MILFDAARRLGLRPTSFDFIEIKVDFIEQKVGKIKKKKLNRGENFY